MIKPLFLLFLSLSLCLTTLAGCQPAGGSSSGPENILNSSESSSEEPAREPFTPSEDSVKIRWAMHEFAAGYLRLSCEKGEDGSYELLDEVESQSEYTLLDEFNYLLQEKGYNFHLEIVSVNFKIDRGAGFHTRLSETENIDIASTNGAAIELIANEFFYPLDEYLTQDNAEYLRNLYHPSIWEGAKYQGKTYCLPNGYSSPLKLMISFNKNYVSQELIDSFSGNFADLAPILEQLEDDNYIPLCYETSGTVELPSVLSEVAANVLLLSNDGSGAQSPTRFQPLVDHMCALNQYHKARYLKHHDPTLKNTSSTFFDSGAYLGKDLYAVHIFQSYFGIRTDEADNFACFELRDAYFPTTLGMTGIVSASEHKDEAFALLQAIFTDSDLANCLTYGVEGAHYEIHENGCATKPGVEPDDVEVDPFTKVEYTPTPSDIRGGFFGFYEAAAPVFGEVEGNNRKEAKQKYFENEVVQSPYLGKYFDPTGYEEILAEVIAIWNENCDLIWQSDDFEAELARVDALLQDAGIDTLIAAVNEQYGIEP